MPKIKRPIESDSEDSETDLNLQGSSSNDKQKTCTPEKPELDQSSRSSEDIPLSALVKKVGNQSDDKSTALDTSESEEEKRATPKSSLVNIRTPSQFLAKLGKVSGNELQKLFAEEAFQPGGRQPEVIKFAMVKKMTKYVPKSTPMRKGKVKQNITSDSEDDGETCIKEVDDGSELKANHSDGEEEQEEPSGSDSNGSVAHVNKPQHSSSEESCDDEKVSRAKKRKSSNSSTPKSSKKMKCEPSREEPTSLPGGLKKTSQKSKSKKVDSHSIEKILDEPMSSDSDSSSSDGSPVKNKAASKDSNSDEDLDDNPKKGKKEKQNKTPSKNLAKSSSSDEESDVNSKEEKKRKKSKTPSKKSSKSVSSGEESDDTSKEEKKGKKGKTPNKKPSKSSSSGEKSDGNSKEEKKGKKSKAPSKKPSKSSSSGEESDDGSKEEGNEKKSKTVSIKPSKSSSSDVESDDSSKEEKKIKKNKTASKKPSKSSSSDEDSDDGSKEEKKGKQSKKTSEDPRILKLQRYVREAGIRVKNYKTLWEGCKSKKSRVEKLMDLLREHGLKGKPTLKSCQKLRRKIEREKEVAELNTSNIIATSGRPRRSASSLYVSQSPHSAGKSPANTENSAEFKKSFSRLKNIVDSEESD